MMNQFLPAAMFFPFAGFMWLLGIAAIVAWFWVLVDVAKHTFQNSYEKPLWVLALLLVPAPAILGYIVVIKIANNSQGVLPKNTPEIKP